VLRVITVLGKILTPGPTIVAAHCGAHEGLREGPREGPGRRQDRAEPGSWAGDALHHRPTLKYPTGPCHEGAQRCRGSPLPQPLPTTLPI
jgi:hypothetical protein